MQHKDLEKALREYKQGNKKSFEKIYKLTVDRVFRYVYSRVGNKQWTEDIVSETYLTLIDILLRFDGTSKIETFIIGIANNKIKQHFAKVKESVNLEDEEEFLVFIEEVESELSSLKKESLDLILNKLPKEYKKVLICRFIKGQSIKDTALDLKISEANVRVIQHRALQKAFEIAKELKIYE